MRIFICWSGRRGSAAAEALAQWLQQAFDGLVTPQVSHDIEKGSAWFDQLRHALDESSAGLLCLTPEALSSPWVNYEAGALSNAVGANTRPDATPTGRLFTFLWGVQPAELSGPLSLFQSTMADDPRDVRRMCQALLASVPDRTEAARRAAVLDKEWDSLWDGLRTALALIPWATLPEVWPEFERLFRRKTFEEATADCVTQTWLERYEGARTTAAALAQRRAAVERACRVYVVDLYHALERELQGYAMAISMLVGRPLFPIDDDGRVQIQPAGLAAASESRRRRIRHLAAALVDPRQAPFFDEAVSFHAAEEFAERKNIIHRLTPRVQEVAAKLGVEGTLPLYWAAAAFRFELLHRTLLQSGRVSPRETGPQLHLEREWSTSDWDLDRVMYALFLEHHLRLRRGAGPAAEADVLGRALALAEAELEKTRARQPEPTAIAAGARHASVMPLHYALGPFTLPAEPDGLARERLRVLSRAVTTFLDARGTRDEPVRATLREIDGRLDVRAPRPRSGQSPVGIDRDGSA
jgi:hypothetical protein